MGGDSGLPIYDLSSHQWGYTEPSKRDATFLAAFALLIVLSLTLSSVVTHRWKVTLLPEACVVLSVGLLAGFACKAAYGATHRGFFSRPLMDFDNALFFLGLLPPIIFYSGYDLHPRWLFGLFVQIMTFAIAGTFISALVVGVWLSVVSKLGIAPSVSFAETLTFGALISATDPVSVLAVFTELKVDPKMFYLVFGESVLNDAVGIVLYKTFSKYVGYKHSAATLGVAVVDFIVIFAGSMLLGFACAIATALCLKVLRVPEEDEEHVSMVAEAASPSSSSERDDDHSDEHAIESCRHMQMAILACAIYVPAFLAELVELSGIVATLFAAIGCRHWGMPNLQELHALDESQNLRAESLLGTLAHLADTAVFLYLGLSVPAAADDWRTHFSLALVFWSILACLVGRAVHVYSLSHLLNRHVIRKAAEQFGGRPRAMANIEVAVQAASIPRNMQHMLWFSGLRGAVAFSCAHTFPNREDNRALFSVTTSTLIIFSMYLLGALTTPVLDYLKIPTNCEVERRHPDSPLKQGRGPSLADRRDAARRALRRNSGLSPSALRHASSDVLDRSDSGASICQQSDGAALTRHLVDVAAALSPRSLEAPRPSRPFRRLGLLDEAYIYPAVVRPTPRRYKRKRHFAPLPIALSEVEDGRQDCGEEPSEQEHLTEHTPVKDDQELYEAPQSLEMVNIRCHNGGDNTTQRRQDSIRPDSQRNVSQPNYV